MTLTEHVCRNTHVVFTNEAGDDVVGVVKGHSVRSFFSKRIARYANRL